MSVELRPCGFQGWAVCDGNCEKCQTTATTHTHYNPIEIARQYAPKFDKPAVDMVEVVRCKDCKWYSHFRSITGSLLPEGRCGYHTIYPAPDDYCSRGERKEVEE